MDSHLPDFLGAYVNLPALFRHRGGYALELEPMRPNHVRDEDLENGLTPQDTVSDLTMKFGRWEVVAARPAPGDGGAREVMVVYIILDGSKAASSSSEFASLFSAAEKQARDLGPQHVLAEVIVLASEAVTKKTNLRQQMVNLAKRGAKKSPRVWQHLYPFHIFSTVVPDHPCVPRHEIISPSAVASYLPHIQFAGDDPAARAKAAAASLPLILADDPAVVWLGARPGDFVLVHRPSETASEFAMAVRYVV